MKKVKNKKSLIALLLVGLLGIVGGTIAYFTNTVPFENIFKTPKYETKATETFTSPENWLPGTTTDKDLIVTNSGDVEVGVRISYSENWKDKDNENLSLTLPNSENRAAIINFTNTNDWKLQDGYYYYKDTLAKNESTNSFISGVTFNSLVGSSLESVCTTTVEDGVTTKTCSSSSDYEGASYTLTINVETIQADAVKTAWNYNY